MLQSEVMALYHLHNEFDNFVNYGTMTPKLFSWFILGVLESNPQIRIIHVGVTRLKLCLPASKYLLRFFRYYGVEIKSVNGRHLYFPTYDVKLFFHDIQEPRNPDGWLTSDNTIYYPYPSKIGY